MPLKEVTLLLGNDIGEESVPKFKAVLESPEGTDEPQSPDSTPACVVTRGASKTHQAVTAEHMLLKQA